MRDELGFVVVWSGHVCVSGCGVRCTFKKSFLGREEFGWFYDSASVFIVFLALFSLGKFYISEIVI